MDEQAEQPTISDALQATQIALDNYDDIFSDFDPSPYSNRLLSYDFLKELRRRYSETRRGELEVNFTMPKNLRSQKTETIIKKRLKDYFKSRLKKIDETLGDLHKKGVIRIALGLIASAGLFFIPADNIPALTLLSVLVWYLLWSGYEYLFDDAGSLRKKSAFYNRFVKAKFNFVDEEAIVEQIQKVQGATPAQSPGNS